MSEDYFDEYAERFPGPISQFIHDHPVLMAALSFAGVAILAVLLGYLETKG